MPMNPRLLRPRQTGLSDPRTIAGLIAWYDAADSSSMGPTSSGTGAVSNNGPVKFLSDKSGNGNHLTQTGADSVAPSFVSSSLNGRSALSFDGGDALERLSFTAMMTVPYSLFIVCRAISPTGSPRACGVGPQRSIGPFASSNTQWGFFMSSTSTVLSFGGSATAATVLCMTVNSSNAALLYANGALGSSASISVPTLAGFGLGADQQAGSTRLSGVIYECMSWSSVLSDANRRAVTGFLSKKWGIAVA